MMKKLDIVIPVYHGNLHEIAPCIQQLVPFLKQALYDYEWKMIFAVNGQDQEEIISLVKELNTVYPRVWFCSIARPGKGSGVIHAWTTSDAEILAYMDVDLSADLSNFRNLIIWIDQGADFCIGSRYHPESKVERSMKRKIISIIYHKAVIKILLGAKSYTDAQCGFKAVSQRVVKEILPLVKSRDWFFESEMLYIGQRKKFTILEFPVQWKESKFSSINLYKAIWEFMKASVKINFRKF